MASSPGDVLVGNYNVITDGNIAGHDGWSDSEMVGSSSVVVRAGCAALPRSTDTTLVCFLCIIAVICMIPRIRIGMIRMRLQVRHMWRTIILTFRRGGT